MSQQLVDVLNTNTINVKIHLIHYSVEEKLGPYNGEHIIAHLPEGKTLADYTWISVWCRQAGVSNCIHKLQ